MKQLALAATSALLGAACAHTAVPELQDAPAPHHRAEVRSAEPISHLPWLRFPRLGKEPIDMPPLLISSVQVHQLPLAALVRAFSQQEGLSHDIDDCGAIPVSLSQQEIELTELLERLADLATIRWRLTGDRLQIRCDQPFTRTYMIDYPALERSGQFNGNNGLPGMGANMGAGLATGGGGTGIGAGAAGQQQTASRHYNRHWDSLVQTLEQWLAAGEELAEPTRITETELARSEQGISSMPTDRRSKAGAREVHPTPNSPTALDSSVSRTVVTRVDQRRSQISAHPESGLLHIRASARQHRQLVRALAQTRLRSRQQVEIEAMLLEVRLTRQYERGIQWQRKAVSLTPALPLSVGPGLIFSPTLSEQDSAGLALRFLEQFGSVQVLSSPRVVAMHQQSAILRMVENRVYFTVTAQSVPAGPNSAAFSTFNTQAHTVPVGFTMTVLPHIDASQGVTLTLRPTLSRIIGFVSDPNPGLVTAGINSRIPEVQTREIESVLRLQNGQVALLGGFIQSESRSNQGGIPGFSSGSISRWVGTSESEEGAVSELIVLIRTRVTEGGSSV